MGLGRAIAYIFDDNNWFTKIALVLLLSTASLIPVFGLIAVAALLGYLVEIVANVRQRNPIILRYWSNTEQKIADGGALLAAIFVYNLPNLMLSGCLLTAPSLFGDPIVAGSVSLVTLCCLTPLILIYTVFAWSMLAAGTIRLSESHKSGEFYRFGTLFNDLQRNQNSTLQWALLATLLNVILSLLALTICGNLAVLAFAIPVHAHLLGQYGQKVDFAPPTLAAPAPDKPKIRYN
jgi:hypothetical protein